MKKLLGSTLALAMFVPAGANAELLKNFKASGSLEVSAVSANNVTDFSTKVYDKIGNAQTRLMVHGDWDLLDDVHARVTLSKNDRTYGQNTQSVHDIENAVNADESYVKIDKLFGGLDTTLGRQFYGEAGDLVIYFGPKYQLYGMPITSLDGGRFDWNGEKVGVTLLAAKVTGTGLAVTNTGNVNLQGVDIHAKAMDNMSAAVYVYRRETINSTPAVGVVGNDNLYVAGLKAKATLGIAWLKAEIAKDFGQMRTTTAGNPYAFTGNYTGWAAKVNLGAKVDLNNLGAVTGWGEAGIGSGGKNTNRNFQAIAGDYRPGGIYGRFGTGASQALGNGAPANLDGNTLSNRVIVGAGVKVTPAALSKLTAGVSAWNYRFQNAADAAVVTGKGNKGIGTEFDLDLTWAHSENVSVSAGVGSLQPGRNIRDQKPAVNPATLAYTDFSVKF